MVLTPISLRVETVDGSTVEEYRIRGHEVELRAPQSDSNDDATDRDGEWYRLTPEQITMHVQQKTAVAEWLLQRLGWRRLLRACTDPQMVHMFDAKEDTVDHYAA